MIRVSQYNGMGKINLCNTGYTYVLNTGECTGLKVLVHDIYQGLSPFKR